MHKLQLVEQITTVLQWNYFLSFYMHINIQQCDFDIRSLFRIVPFRFLLWRHMISLGTLSEIFCIQPRIKMKGVQNCELHCPIFHARGQMSKTSMWRSRKSSNTFLYWDLNHGIWKWQVFSTLNINTWTKK